jgi:superfamily II DNA/RNA helicase
VKHGFNAVALHGDLDQSARMAALDRFRKGEATLLIASDVAARGLDIPKVSHVFNYDVPHHADDYVHRIGRTGRAGRSGAAITLVAPADGKAVAAIEKLIGQPIPFTEQSAVPSAAPREAAAPERKPHREHRHEKRRHQHSRAPAARMEEVRQRPERPTETRHRPEHATDRQRPEHKPETRRQSEQESDGAQLPAFLMRPFRVKA